MSGERRKKGVRAAESARAAKRTKARRKRHRLILTVIAAACAAAVVLCGVYIVNRQAEIRRQDELKNLAAGGVSTPAPEVTPTSNPADTTGDTGMLAAPTDINNPDERAADNTATPADSTGAISTLSGVAGSTAAPTPPLTPAPTPTPEPTPEWPSLLVYGPNEREIDFEALLSTNPDTVGWIEIPGTRVDDPLVGYAADDLYLDHDFYGEASAYGALYLDEVNGHDLLGANVIIYGHNMKDGRMFAGLHKYTDESFFEKHSIVKIYTPSGQLTYSIFAAYERDNGYIPSSLNIYDRQSYADYLDSIESTALKGAIIDMTGITDDSHIITLSTCVRGGDPARRFIVQAVCINQHAEGENPAIEATKYRALRKGMTRSEGVANMQARLKELNYLDEDADGNFGGNTESAVIAFQEQNGLTPDGVATVESQALLFSPDALDASGNRAG